MILVFGKNGQVATEFKRFKDVMCIGRDKVDLKDPFTCSQAIKNILPQAVINTAAYTAVENAEKEEKIATAINSEAPAAMAMACLELNIPLIHISTDYVFDGNKKSGWLPNDLANPLNAYGRTKLAGEKAIIKSGVTYVILRTSWIISAHGSNFLKTMIKLAETHDNLNIVNDQIGGPTPANDVAKACLTIAKILIKHPEKSGVYHFSGKPNVSWNTLASKIFEVSKQKVVVKPILTSEYKTMLKRPLNSRLDCSTTKTKFGIVRPDWRIGIKQILKDLEIIS